VATNLGFLYRLVNHEDFCRGALDTGLIERGRAELLPQAAAPDTRTLALAIAAILDQEQHSMPDDPWRALGAWRLNAHAHRRFLFAREEAPETVYAVALSAREPGQWLIEEAHPQTHPQTHHQAHHQARLSYRCEGEQITLSLDGVACTGDVIRLGDQFTVSASHETTTLRLIDVREQAKSQDSEGGRLTAPMPGKVVALLVGPGSAVTRGAPLLIMEAMKMEHTIAAPSDGIVAEILYAVGDQVDDGAQLLVFQAPAKVP
jgi:3-methylcrotonyl-CoA carboxylase alpha subunit